MNILISIKVSIKGFIKIKIGKLTAVMRQQWKQIIRFRIRFRF